MSELHIHNSLSRQKEKFEPLTPGHVGLYVCGPTVSGESHLGHARPYITFDVVSRYLKHLGYRVRYVRNITDAGHFEEEGRDAVDKVGEKAKLEQMEPMELVHKYTNLFHWGMRLFNNQDPAIEPTATGHIVEQISMIEDIMAKGYAYEVNGSVYFDVKKYAEHYPYGELSGRIIDDLLETTRELEGQDEKRNKVDFALWKAAPPQHIQRWQSPWGEGFPGWHIECSAMSAKYLGTTFDIHGGGMDLQFPHHESEIAQSTIAHGHPPVRYWMHNNMITINSRKMGRSYNNIIKLTELFSGNHPLLEQPYHPMVVRFYILQTHYRSTLDFSNEALQASEKALRRLWEGYEVLNTINSSTWFDLLLNAFLGREGADWFGQYRFYKSELDVFLQEFALATSREMWSTSDPNPGTKLINDFLNNNAPIINRETDFELLSRALYLVPYEVMAGLNASIVNLCEGCDRAMDDDFHTPTVIANLFELVRIINGVKMKVNNYSLISVQTFSLLAGTFKTYLEDILGLKGLQPAADNSKLDKAIAILGDIRRDAKTRKDFATSDAIRNKLAEAGILLKDEKDGGFSYTLA